MNRIGDFGFLIGILLIFYMFRSLDFSVVFSLISLFENSNFILLNINYISIQFICFFLFLGSCGKSAQLILHTWLPDAMEGPTPVSALIHAATMVTAGIFLIIRCSVLFEASSYILSFITLIGVVTAFFASTIGLFQHDIKKVIAYSTCSQLGYMIFTCGISQYHSSMFHLINHAFFKALLFLSAGSIIHSLSGEQDMRKMGSLLRIIPLTYISILIGSFALTGFPFLSGFYSKDLILELTYST
jgi:NADH:ubiquinone oxidoreductase subunit 5 (subunit L)/multisubunit Na+/H+ antiporter MnhA subunit